MAYIKKNVNFVLILLSLTLIASFIGFTTYYQTTYRNLTQEYNLKVNELQQAQGNITKQRDNLQNTQNELQLRVADKTKFESLYTDLVQEKNKLDTQLAFTRGTLATTQSQLAESLSTLQTTQGTLNDIQNQLSSTTQMLQAVTKQRDNYCTQLRNFNSTVSC